MNRNSASKKQRFSEDEVRKLEFEFIKAYSGGQTNTIKLLFTLYRKNIKHLLLSLFFLIIKTSPIIILPLVTANFINLIFEKPDNMLTLFTTNLAVVVLLMLLYIPSNALCIKHQCIAFRRVEAGLRGAIVRKLQQLSIPFHREMQSGKIQSKLMRDVETVYDLSAQLFTSIPAIIINITSAVAIIIINNPNPVILLFFLLCIPCAVISVYGFRKKLRNSYKQYREDMEKAGANLVGMVEMTEVTRAHGLGHHEINKINVLLRKLAAAGTTVDKNQGLYGAVSWVIFQFFQMLCLVFSAYMAYRQEIQIGDIALYQAYFATLTGQISSLVNLLPVISKGFDSVSSIGEILSSDDIEDNTGKEKITSLDGNFEFENVHFAYKEDQPIFKGLDLSIKKGETIAIVGESGAGKTTLMSLILGFVFPDKGGIFIDGKDITKINLHTYRKHLAVVPQQSILFMGTIRENITYGIDNVTDEMLKSVMDAALITDFVSKLPNGIDTHLGEHGCNLSGGQRQRISIARALIRDPDVIIFDEATSALDTISEKEIQEAINNLSKDKTTFIVAHRLSTIKNADRIIVIKDGVLCEEGTFSELVEKKGEFYNMQQLQVF